MMPIATLESVWQETGWRIHPASWLDYRPDLRDCPGPGRDADYVPAALPYVQYRHKLGRPVLGLHTPDPLRPRTCGTHPEPPDDRRREPHLPVRGLVRTALRGMGYTLEDAERTSGPINAILFDRKHGTMWGASSNHGEDYGIAW